MQTEHIAQRRVGRFLASFLYAIGVGMLFPACDSGTGKTGSAGGTSNETSGQATGGATSAGTTATGGQANTGGASSSGGKTPGSANSPKANIRATIAQGKPVVRAIEVWPVFASYSSYKS